MDDFFLGTDEEYEVFEILRAIKEELIREEAYNNIKKKSLRIKFKMKLKKKMKKIKLKMLEHSDTFHDWVDHIHDSIIQKRRAEKDLSRQGLQDEFEGFQEDSDIDTDTEDTVDSEEGEDSTETEESNEEDTVDSEDCENSTETEESNEEDTVDSEDCEDSTETEESNEEDTVDSEDGDPSGEEEEENRYLNKAYWWMESNPELQHEIVVDSEAEEADNVSNEEVEDEKEKIMAAETVEKSEEASENSHAASESEKASDSEQESVSGGEEEEEVEEMMDSDTEPSEGGKRQHSATRGEKEKKTKSGAETKSNDPDQQKESEEDENNEDEENAREILESPSEVCHLCTLKNEVSEGKLTKLDADQSELLKIKYDAQIETLCRWHYFSELVRKKPKKCVDPMSKHAKPRKTKIQLADIDFIIKILKHTEYKVWLGDYFCSDCKSILEEQVESRISDLSQPQSSLDPLSQNSNWSAASNDPDVQALKEEENAEDIEGIFSLAKLSPIKKGKLNNKAYLEDKISSLVDSVRRKLHLSPKKKQMSENETEMIENLRYAILGKSPQQVVELLSILPQHIWTYEKFSQTFGVSRRTIEKIKHFEATGCHQERKVRSDKISDETVEKVKAFYFSQGVSRAMAGMRDFVKVKTKNGVEELQKHVLLMSVDEAHQLFLSENPDIKIGITKFHEIKPVNVVFLGSKGTTEFCLCIYCHNCLRIINSSIVGEHVRFYHLTRDPEKPDRKPSKVMMEKLLCLEKTDDCYRRLCPQCKDNKDDLIEEIESILQDMGVQMVSYEMWTNQDRCKVASFCKPPADFARFLVGKLEEFATHVYVDKNQSHHIKSLQKNLPENTCFIIGDFSQNYSFFEAQEVQSAHWSRGQVTLFTAMFYMNKSGVLSSQPAVVISENAQDHSAAAVYSFYTIFNEYLSATFPQRRFQYYASDGAGMQT